MTHDRSFLLRACLLASLGTQDQMTSCTFTTVCMYGGAIQTMFLTTSFYGLTSLWAEKGCWFSHCEAIPVWVEEDWTWHHIQSRHHGLSWCCLHPVFFQALDWPVVDLEKNRKRKRKVRSTLFGMKQDIESKKRPWFFCLPFWFAFLSSFNPYQEAGCCPSSFWVCPADL